MTLTAQRPKPSPARPIWTRAKERLGRYRYWSLQRSEIGRWRRGEDRLPWAFMKRGRARDGAGTNLTIGLGAWALFVGRGHTPRAAGMPSNR